MAKYEIAAALNPHQHEFINDETSKYLHLSSGFGGGKSFVLALKLFKLSRVNRHVAGGIVVPSIPDYKKDLLPLIEEILDVNRIAYRYHQTDKWFRFPWSKARAYVATAEKRIRGNNWGWAVVNELGLISHERYKETIGRVRVKDTPCPQIASSGTPEGTGHWLHETFVESPKPKSRIIYGDTRDNAANLAPDYIQSLQDSFDPIMLDAYLKGLFVNMKGSRFYYGYDPKLNDDLNIEQIVGADVHVSLDYNVQPLVATLWNIVNLTNRDGVPLLDAQARPLKRARAFDSIVIEDGADVHKLDRALRERDLDPNTTILYPDPAGSSRNVAVKGAKAATEVLRGLGWHRIQVKNSAPRMRQRQLAHCNLLAKGYVKLHPIRCKPLKKDYESVEQDKATFEKIKTNPKLTHASDGADYFLDHIFPFSGHKPESGSVKFR